MINRTDIETKNETDKRYLTHMILYKDCLGLSCAKCLLKESTFKYICVNLSARTVDKIIKSYIEQLFIDKYGKEELMEVLL